MKELRCPFERLLVANTHACAHALNVTRREGAGVDCSASDFHTCCTTLQQHFEKWGAEAFGEIEDRTQVSHSTLLKIQVGGLEGVNQQLGLTPDAATADVGALAQQASSLLDTLDASSVIATMQQVRTRRRTSGRRPGG